MIKDNILSKITFLTIFVPLTVVFVWKPTSFHINCI